MGNVKSIIQVTLWVALIILLLKTFVLDFYHVRSNSMEKTLMAGDRIFVSRVNNFLGFPASLPFGIKIDMPQRIWYRDIRKGDIIVFNMQGSNEITATRTYVKRVAAVPGDRIVFRGDSIYINERLLKGVRSGVGNTFPDRFIIPGRDYPVLNSGFGPRQEQKIMHYSENGRSLVNWYYVIGDNHENSYDSRYWGLVPGSAVIGRPLFIYWSSGGDGGIRLERFFKWIR